MNRRRFLTMLGLAPVVAKLAPLLPVPKTVAYRTYVMGENAILTSEPGAVGPVSYRFKFVTYPLNPTANMHLRRIVAEESIA